MRTFNILAQLYLLILYIYTSIRLEYNSNRSKWRCVMPVSKAQQKATNKWIEKAYDRINLTVPKGQKEAIKAHAEAQGESVNGFINRAIAETIERDGQR